MTHGHEVLAMMQGTLTQKRDCWRQSLNSLDPMRGSIPVVPRILRHKVLLISWKNMASSCRWPMALLLTHQKFVTTRNRNSKNEQDWAREADCPQDDRTVLPSSSSSGHDTWGVPASGRVCLSSSWSLHVWRTEDSLQGLPYPLLCSERARSHPWSNALGRAENDMVRPKGCHLTYTQ